jgi:peroxiredoxin
VGEQSEGMRVMAKPGEMKGLVLLSDKNAEVIDAYGVKPLEINGSKYASRATFVIDKQGILRYVNYNYKVREDYEPLLEVLAGLE